MGKKRQEKLGPSWKLDKWMVVADHCNGDGGQKKKTQNADCQRQYANQVRTWGLIDGLLCHTCADHYGICSTKGVRVERRLDAIFTVDVYDMCGYIGTRGDVEWSAPTIAKAENVSN